MKTEMGRAAQTLDPNGRPTRRPVNDSVSHTSGSGQAVDDGMRILRNRIDTLQRGTLASSLLFGHADRMPARLSDLVRNTRFALVAHAVDAIRSLPDGCGLVGKIT